MRTLGGSPWRRGPWPLALVLACAEGGSDRATCAQGAVEACGLADAGVGQRTCRGGAWSACGGAEADGGAVEPPPPPTAPAPPLLTPCPAGWGEVVDASGLATCDPYPVGGPTDCPSGRAQWPGEPGCAPVGAACPVDGDFADGLPADRPIVYVLAGAAGGDGTRERPFGSLAEADLARLARGTVVAIGRGTYDENVRLPTGVTLWGACPEETTLTSSEPSETDAVLTSVGADVAVRDLTIGPSARLGVEVLQERSLSLEGTAVEGNRVIGVFVLGQLVAERLVVRDTQSRPSDGALGRGLDIELGASVTVARAVIERNLEVGIDVDGVGTTVALADVAVRGTESRERDGTSGRGLSIQRGASGTVVRTVIEANREVGVHVDAAGTTVALEDVLVRGTQGRRSDGTLGRGLAVQAGASASAVRVVLEENQESGIYVIHEGTTLDLEDVVVRRTSCRPSDGTLGRGLEIQLGASASVARAVLEDNHELGVWVVDEGTTVNLQDVVVRGTQSQLGDGAAGLGLGVQAGASATVTRALFDRNRYIGILADGAGTRVALEDVGIVETLEAECALGGCAGAGAGHGLIAVRGGSATAKRFEIVGSALCGLMIAREGFIDLDAGRVADNPIGACIQVEGYDLSRLQRHVVYDNPANLEATDLAVPEPRGVDP